MRRQLLVAVLAVPIMVASDHPRLLGTADAETTTIIMGTKTIGSLSRSVSPDHKFGSVYPLAEAGTTVSFSWYTSGGPVAQRMTPAVYDVDDSGNPSRLVVEGGPVTVSANSAPGWVTSTLPAVALSPGRYMLALLAGAAGADALSYYNRSAGAGVWNSNLSPTPTTGWGQVNREDAQWSYYVTLSAAGVVPTAPVNQNPPTISGTARIGQTLTGDRGTWTGTPTPSIVQQWRRCHSGCADIAGATATTYSVTSADLGSQLQLVAVATNSAGSGQATSLPTATVTGNSTTATLGATTPGTKWSLPSAGYKFGSVYALAERAKLVDFNWYASGGSAPQSFVPAIYNTDASGGPTTLVTTGAAVTVTASQAPGWVTSPLAPGITLEPGNYLLALLSGPSGNQALSYYDREPYGGVYNANPYPVASSPWGTVNRDSRRWSFFLRYQSGSAPAPPTNQTPPTINGSPVRGQTLTASPGSWSGAPTAYAHQWKRCRSGACAPVVGATTTSYALSDADVGATILVEVTATNAGGSATAASAPAGPVSAPPPYTIQPFSKYVIDPNVPGAIVEKAVGDIDGDGRLDIVIGTEASSTQPGGGVYWYQFPRSGNPADAWPKRTILPTGNAYEDMVTLDVDGDGRIDVAANVNGNLYWFRNPGNIDGTWQQNLIGGIFGEGNIAVGDLDGDGKTDIATNAYVFFQNSPTNWTRIPMGNSFMGMALLDSGSGLGSINLVTSDGNAPYGIVWYENPRVRGGDARNASGWIKRAVGPGYSCSGGGGQCPRTVASIDTGDYNGDGRMDIAIGQAESTSVPPGGLRWFEAPLDRSTPWIGRTIDATLEYSHNIRSADIDGNGALDLVTGEQDQSTQRRVTVFYNDGSGNFTLQVLSTDATHNVAVGDVDGDGDIDIVASPHGYYGDAHPLQLYLNGRF